MKVEPQALLNVCIETLPEAEISKIAKRLKVTNGEKLKSALSNAAINLVSKARDQSLKELSNAAIVWVKFAAASSGTRDTFSRVVGLS